MYHIKNEGKNMSDLQKNKHLIGTVLVMLLVQLFIMPKGIIGTIISLLWIISIIYAQIKGAIQYKEKPEIKDYFMIHVDAVKYTATHIFKS